MKRQVSIFLLGAAAVGAAATLLLVLSHLLPSDSRYAIASRLDVLVARGVITNQILRSKAEYSKAGFIWNKST